MEFSCMKKLLLFLAGACLLLPLVAWADTAPEAQEISNAQAQTRATPNSAEAWKALADAYKQNVEDEQTLRNSAYQGYLMAHHKAIQLQYGTLTQPKNLQQAVELAVIYSNQWEPPCSGAECESWAEPDLYRQLIDGVRTKPGGWDVSSPAERAAAQELNRKNAEWTEQRTDVFSTANLPVGDVVQIDSSSTEQTVTPVAATPTQAYVLPFDKRWLYAGGTLVILLLALGVWKMGKKI